MQELSLSCQSFEQLRTQNLIYVDKTEHIYRVLVKPSVRAFFLARPRRFGKSLTVSTLEAIFQGKRHLFEGLAISKTDYQWPVHPVVRLDFAEISKATPKEFETEFKLELRKQGKQHGVTMPEDDAPLGRLGTTLIRGLREKTGKAVALLVDEYDKPILDCIEQPQIADQMRAVMKSFFDVVKPLAEALHCTFITGVGRFSLAGLSSGLNHMDDLSTDTRAAILVGYTQQELEHYFSNHLAQYAATFPHGMPALLEQIRLWYNGYRFSDVNQRVYNPFSIMKFMQTGKFNNYWFATGTPSFLIKLMVQSNHWRTRFTGITQLVTEQLIIDEVTDLSPDAILFQAGYLTIKDIIPAASYSQTDAYALTYPNLEVEHSMHSCILTAMTQVSYKESVIILRNLNDALRTAHIDAFLRTMQTIFARIPYQIEATETQENYYHAIFSSLCQVLEFTCQAEFNTNLGRIDVVITTDTHVMIFELKVDKSIEKALNQIKETEYAQSFFQSGKQILLIGIVFDSKKRNIATWHVEPLPLAT